MGTDGRVDCRVGVNPLIWQEDSELMESVTRECNAVTVVMSPPEDSPRGRAHHWTDAWGCTWHFPGKYLDGVVEGHPLSDWGGLSSWSPPDGDARAAEILAACSGEGGSVRPARGGSYGVEHGFLFLRLTYLRGFTEAMIDIAMEDPRLFELRDVVADYWLKVVSAYCECGAGRVTFGDDLGLQDRLPMSPDQWRKLIKPAYAELFQRVRNAGAEVYLHTDGYILDIIPDLIHCGVTILNPQDLVNGLDRLAEIAKGRVNIDLDIDRQSVTVFGTPAEIDAHIRRCVETLGSPNGGLSLVYGAYPGTPPENVAAVVRGMQAYHDMWM